MSVYEFLSVDIDTDLDAKTSISGGKDPYFGSSYQISTFFDDNIEKKNVDIDVFVMTISNVNVDIGITMLISGMISYLILRFEFWQDRVLSCAILPEMLQTMSWMMITQWIKMSASFTRINYLNISQHQLGPMAQFLSDMPDFL
jgi:hypothetical protein